MCTVSFYKGKDELILTSNRDEKLIRKSALPPKEYIIDGVSLVFPRDQEKGGTWFAYNKENHHTLILLNGAFEKHVSKNNYRKSRGLIVLDIIKSINPLDTYQSINLNEIEPFTCVLYSHNTLHELIWDGETKLSKELTEISKIWSSSTLYTLENKKKREKLFDEFISHSNSLKKEDFISFHTTKSDSEEGFVINRNNELKTLSVTQIVFSKQQVDLTYLDLIKDKYTSIEYKNN